MLNYPGPMIDLTNAVNYSHPLNRQLVSWFLTMPWPRWSGGATWRDMMMRHDGTLTNITSSSAWRGPTDRTGGRGSLTLDGSNDYVNLGNGLNNTGELSIFAWIRPATVASGVRSIFSNSNSAGSAVDYVFEINRTAARLSVLRNAAAVNLTSSTNLSADTWYHVGLTISGTTSNWDITLWLNGKSDGNTTTSQNPNGGTKGTSIGRLGEFNGHYFSGLIDDVRYYDRALSSSEVQAVYLESLLGYPHALNWLSLPWWSTQEPAATTGAALLMRMIG